MSPSLIFTDRKYHSGSSFPGDKPFLNSTEVSVISLMIPGKCLRTSRVLIDLHENFIVNLGYDWEYFSFPALITPHMVPQANNTFELVVIVSKSMRV